MFPPEYPFKPPGIKVRPNDRTQDSFTYTLFSPDDHTFWTLRTRQEDMFLNVRLPSCFSRCFRRLFLKLKLISIDSGTLRGVLQRCPSLRHFPTPLTRANLAPL